MTDQIENERHYDKTTAKFRREKSVRLIRYGDNELHGEHVWFYVNSHDQKISDDFKSQEAAQEWLENRTQIG